MRNLIILLFLCTTAFGQGKSMLGTQIDISHPLGDPIAFLLFNEGSGGQVYDLSERGNDLTFNGNVSWASGKFGPALNFPGVLGDYVSGTIPELYRKPKTFIAWISRKTYTNAHVIFSIGDVPSDSSPQTIVRIQTDDVISAFGDVTGNGYDYLETTETITDDTWHQIVFVDRCDGAQAYHLYLDGIECTYSDGVPNNYQDHTNTANTIYIGTGYNNFEYEGLIDHISIYDRALSASEIAQLYREPVCMMAKDDVALWTPEAAAAPTGGQVIMIQAAIPMLLFFVIYLKMKQGEDKW